MRINLNLYKKYQQYKQSRPIRLVAEEVQEGCRDGCKSCAENWDDLVNKFESASKSASDLADTFEQIFDVPPQVETDFGNGVKLLERRIKKEERDSIELAEDIN